MKGTIQPHILESKLLKDNAAGEDHRRPLLVYTPPDYDPKRQKPYNLVLVLAPWTNAGRNAFDWKPFKESLPVRLERLMEAGTIGDTVVVAPDLYTRYGGSQFIDSDYFGPHAAHLAKEVLPFVQKKYNVSQDPDRIGVFGRSSGGFGALRLAQDYPGVFGRVASHSGDLGFDTMFLGDLQTFPRLLGRYRDDVEAYLNGLLQKPKIQGYEMHALMLVGCSGFYSPSNINPLGFDFPIDLYSGEINWEVWQRWKAHDPLERDLQGFKETSMVYIECGLRDQYHLLYGARQLHGKLELAGIAHEYEEFDDNHSGTDYRYDVSLPLLSPV
jgi:enterochelin esterase-like enzyme